MSGERNDAISRRALRAVVFPWFLLLPCLLSAQQMQVTIDPAQTRIDWTLGATMHTVHGTFKLKSGTVVFDPKSGEASGAIIVDATSGESGNQDRDKDMHTKVLESAQYPEIAFVPKHVTGSVAEQGQSKIQVQGVLRIHGGEHDVTLIMQVEKTGDNVKASTPLVVPYQEWGMKNPNKAFLHVDKKVDLTISAVGKMSAAVAR
jgi:polyisoprenoid-binding protein YceI